MRRLGCGFRQGFGPRRRTAEAGLGKLVHFEKRGHYPKARPAAAGPALAGDAKIYIFTGVRYQRDGTPIPGKPLGTTRAKRKRV